MSKDKEVKEVEAVQQVKKYQIRLKEAKSYRLTPIKKTFYRNVPVNTSDEVIVNACKNDDAFEVKEIN
jgi:hypothetical protein